MISERQHIIDLIHEATGAGARLTRSCEEAGISLRTYRRWYQCGTVQQDLRPETQRAPPSNKLSKEEQEAIIAVANEPEYASLPPSQIVPILLDKGKRPANYRVDLSDSSRP